MMVYEGTSAGASAVVARIGPNNVGAEGASADGVSDSPVVSAWVSTSTPATMEGESATGVLESVGVSDWATKSGPTTLDAYMLNN